MPKTKSEENDQKNDHTSRYTVSDIKNALELCSKNQTCMFVPEGFFDYVENSEGFFRAKQKYIAPSLVGNVYSLESLNKLKEMATIISNSELSAYEFLKLELGEGTVDADIKGSDLDDFNEFNTQFNIAVKVINDTVKLFEDNDQENYTFRDLDANFNKEWKDDPFMKDFIPFSFVDNCTNTGLFGKLMRNDLGSSLTYGVFKVASEFITDQMNTSISNSLNVEGKKPEFVSFSSSGSTGCVNFNPSKEEWHKYNYTYDTTIKVEMYEKFCDLTYDETMDMLDDGFSTIGFRLMMYALHKRHKRLTFLPVGNPDHVPDLKEFDIEQGVQENHDGYNPRSIVGVGSLFQFHGSHVVQMYLNGMTPWLAKRNKFTPNSLNDSLNDYHTRLGLVGVTSDVVSNDYKNDIDAILNGLFKNLFNGKFYELMSKLYYKVPTVGFFSDKLGQIRTYIQGSQAPNRFTSGSIFTGLGNAWYYNSVQLATLMIHKGIMDGTIKCSVAAAYNLDASVFEDMLKNANSDDFLFVNQGDDCTDFIKNNKESVNLYKDIVNSCPYAELAFEDDIGMLGKIYRLDEKTNKYFCSVRYATLASKSQEKYEGRSDHHSLRPAIFGSMFGKYLLNKEFPLDGDKSYGDSIIEKMTNTMGLSSKVDSKLAPLLKDIEDAVRLRDPKASSKQETIDALMDKFDLSSSHMIFWALSASDIANSGIEGIDDLFILKPFDDGFLSPFFSEDDRNFEYKTKHSFTVANAHIHN